jgi:hypothetical protein
MFVAYEEYMTEKRWWMLSGGKGKVGRVGSEGEKKVDFRCGYQDNNNTTILGSIYVSFSTEVIVQGTSTEQISDNSGSSPLQYQSNLKSSQMATESVSNCSLSVHYWSRKALPVLISDIVPSIMLGPRSSLSSCSFRRRNPFLRA